MSDSRVLSLREVAPRLGDAAISSIMVAVLITGIGWFMVWEAVWQTQHLIAGMIGFGILASVVNLHWAIHQPGARFGEANQTTLLRSGLVCLIGSTLIADGPTPEISWYLIGMIAVALALDAVDGFLARRLRLSSAFGARFDMEIDALLLLILSLLVWQTEQAGAWVLAIGLMRYAFVGASWFFPSLNSPLDPSWRRKCVCALQGIALFACLLPPLDQTKASVIAALALAALTISFGLDIKALLLRETPFATTNSGRAS
ncbi:MAG: CDP-alcohol phosphatidyltransferase family protein [Geminicoccaceae bacterium]